MLGLVVVLAELGAGCLHLVLVASAPWHPTSLTPIQFLVILHHIFVNLSPLPVNILILLVELIAVLVTFVVELVNGLRVVPVLVGLVIVIMSVPTTIIQIVLIAAAVLVAETTCHGLALPVEIIDV